MKASAFDLKLITLAVLFLLPGLALAQSEEEKSLANADLAEIDRRLNNPLTGLWSLTFQNNTPVYEGTAIDGTESANTQDSLQIN